MSQRLRTLLLVALLATLFGLGLQVTEATPPPPTLYVSVFGNDSGACTSSGAGACATLQAAVTKALPGATIMIEAGTYIGQVSIGKSLTITGAGQTLTTLQAPATLNPPTLLTLASGQTTIMEVADGATVTLSGLKVSGPGPGSCGSLTYGIFVGEASTLNISQAAIGDIRDQPLGGCQNGIGIRAGSQALGHVATLNATGVTVSAYQKGGIVVDGPGSSSVLDGVQALGVGPHPIIAQNGIQISRGATGTVKNSAISGHECNAGVCGPDPLTQTQSAGILLYQSGAVTVQNNTVQTNDIGVMTVGASGALTLDANALTGNRYEGVYHNSGTLTFSRNTLSGGNIGVFNGSFDGDTANTATTLTNNFINSTTQEAVWNFDQGFSLTDVGPNRPPNLIVCCGEPPYKPKLDKVETDTFFPVLTANDNHLASNPVALLNQSNQAVNAENNWWGSANGPTHPTNAIGVGSQGVTITGANVDYVPWLTSGVDSDAPQPGFQPGAGTSVSPVTTTDPVGQYASIQAGVNASNVGGTVNAAALTFVENVTINKQVTIQGAGSGPSGAVVDPPGDGPVFLISSGGLDATNRLVIKDLRLTGATGSGNTGAGARITGTSSFITFDNVTVTANAGYGIALNGANAQDIKLQNCTVSNNATGFRVGTGDNLDGLTITNCVFEANTFGIETYATSSSATYVKNVTISNTQLTNNVTKGGYFEKLSNATFSNLTVTGNGTSTSFPAGIDINLKYGSYSTISFQGATFTNNGTGNATTGAGLTIKARNDAPSYSANPASLSGLGLTNVSITGSPTDLTLGNNISLGTVTFSNVDLGGTGLGLSLYGQAAGAGLNAADTDFAGALALYASVQSPVEVNATAATINGVAATSMTLAQHFAAADKAVDGVDVAGYGLFRTKAANVYVTPNSFFSPTTTTPSIQRGIDVATAGDTVNVQAGTYTGNLTVNKPLTLLGAQANVLAKGRPGPESIIKPATLATVALDIQSDTVTVNGFKFDGTGATSPWLITAINGAGLDGRFTDLKVLYNQFVGNPGDNSFPGGMYLYATDNVQIEGNYFNDLGQHAVFLAGGSNNAVYRNNDSFGNYNSNLSTQDTDHTNLLAENNRADQDDMILFKLKNSTIRNNTFTSSASSSSRVYLGGGDDGVMVEGNTFNGIRSQAVIAFDAGFGYGQTKNITIKGNTVTTGVDLLTANNSVFDLRSVGGTNAVTENLVTITSSSFPGSATAIYAVGVRGSALGTVTISKNELNGAGLASTGTPPSSGILLRTNDSTYGALPATAVVNITNNTVTGFVNGVSVYNFVGAAYGGLTTGADVNINQNSLAGNSANGLQSGPGELIDAELNWWGSANGPAHPANTFNVGSQGVSAAGNVDFTPWLTNGTDTQPATRGFQPNLTTFAPITNDESESYSNFADAIAGTSENGTITAAAGTFTESVTVDKTLTLRGAQYAVDGRTRCDATSGETIVTGGRFTLAADNITLSGFIIQDVSTDTGLYTSPLHSGYQVRNNVFRNNIMGAYLHSSGVTMSVVEQNCFKTNNATGSASGNGIYSDQGAAKITVTNNKFTGHENCGILFTGVPPTALPSDLTITANELVNDSSICLFRTTTALIQGNTSTGSIAHGVFLGGGNSGITVSNNLLQNAATNYSGIRISDSIGSSPNAGITLTSNNLLNNSYGVRISAGSITASPAVHFNRIVGNTTQGLENLETAITVDAENNWWGCNYGPGASGAGCPTATNGVSGPVDATPWLTLTLSASPTTVEVGATSTATGALTVNSANADTSGSGFVPNGTPISFGATYGNMAPPSTSTTSGQATSTFTASHATGVNPVTTTVDGQTVTRTLTVRAGTGTKPAIVRSNILYLRNSLTTGASDHAFTYGLPSDTFLMCDWNGDGVKTVGVFRNGSWFLKDTNATGPSDTAFTFGTAGDIPLCGDWDHDGTDTVGVARTSGSALQFFLRNTNTTGVADLAFTYGAAGDVPVVGDWNGDGFTTIGVKRGASWYLRNTNSTGVSDIALTYGIASDTPVVGDWDNLSNTQTVGIFRTGGWFVRNANTTGGADTIFTYGMPGDIPLVWK